MQHQHGCAADTPSRSRSQLCTDRRCCLWSDLTRWFGYKKRELPESDFVTYFTDAGHGGSGLFERLCVLGDRALEFLTTLYVAEKYNETAMPPDLVQDLPRAVLQRLWTQKRVERVCSDRALYLFGAVHLSTAQTLPTPAGVAKLVKALIGFGVAAGNAPVAADGPSRASFEGLLGPNQTGERATQPVVVWAPILIDNIFWAQKAKGDADAAVLQDLREYLGYNGSGLAADSGSDQQLEPRVRAAVTGAVDGSEAAVQAEAGKRVLAQILRRYFLLVAQHSRLDRGAIQLWVDSETQQILDSRVPGIFAACYLSLNLSGRFKRPGSDKYAAALFQLLALVSAASAADRVMPWWIALAQRLRQIQLVIHEAELEIKVEGASPADAAALLRAVDLHDMGSIAALKPYRAAGSGGGAGAGPSQPRGLPVSDPWLRRAIRAKEAKPSCVAAVAGFLRGLLAPRGGCGPAGGGGGNRVRSGLKNVSAAGPSAGLAIGMCPPVKPGRARKKLYMARDPLALFQKPRLTDVPPGYRYAAPWFRPVN